MGQTRVAGRSDDRSEARLADAVSRLRRELAAHPVEFADRCIAEDELAVLAAMVAGDDLEIPRMRRSLLLIAGAMGSVSALWPALAELRDAVDVYAQSPPRHRA